MILADEIAKEIMNNQYFHKLYVKCMEYSYNEMLGGDSIINYTEKEYKDLLRFADLLSISSDSQSRGYAYRIITYLNSTYKKEPYYRTVSKSVYYNLGNFPAANYLINNDGNESELPFDQMMQVEAKKIIQEVPDAAGVYFTDTQYHLFSGLSGAREFSFSGPTSMGKSFIIKAFIRRIINNKPPENLVIMVPTRALINQFAIEIKQELGKQLDRANYKIVTNSNVSELILERNVSLVLVLTPERLISFLSQIENPSIGFLFVDEAHKIAQDDTRSVTTYVAIEKTLKKYPATKLYFSSPGISNPEVFLKLFRKTEQNVFKTAETTVAQNLFFADLKTRELSYYYDNKFNNVTTQVPHCVNTVNDFLFTYGRNSNLIYCNTVSKTIEYAASFAESIDLINNKELKNNKALKKASRIIKDYIHQDYYLTEIIKKGVSYHFGNMPQLIRNLIEELYKKGEIRYMFCTSTLLEGVNMPTQNLFILDNKKSKKHLQPIDFWNLAGRAGRMTKELQGNVFCIKHSDCDWANVSFFNNKEEELIPTVFDRINHNLKKIENQIKNNEIKNGTEEEKNILRYIANIISIDTMEPKTGYQSPIIQELISNNKNEIITIAQNKVKEKDIKAPYTLLDSNESIGIDIQNKVYSQLKEKYENGENIKLHGVVDYESCLAILNRFHSLYDWEQTNKELSNKNRMKYYALLMNQWINGFSLNKIVTDSINHYANEQKEISVSYGRYERFDRNNKLHVNILIGNIIKDVEKILRFQFEKYFNHYYMMLTHIAGEGHAGENWATLLEYGTQNRIIIALQNIGLSRHTSNEIYTRCISALTIVNGKLKEVDKKQILKQFEPDTLEYEEVLNLL